MGYDHMSKLPINLTTPHGHRVEARVDDATFQVEMARVISDSSGQSFKLPQETINSIADLVRNNRHHAEAIDKMARVFSDMPDGLRKLATHDPSHPGVAPYFNNEIGPHTEVMERARVNAEQLKLRIGTDADHAVDKPSHGLTKSASKDDGARSV